MQSINLLYEFTNTDNQFLTLKFVHGMIKTDELALVAVEC